MIKYIKEQIEELLTKDEIARIIKVYADEIKHPIEETAIRNYDGYANLISIKDYDINDYLKEHIDESYFYDWCVKQGYFESDEDDE